MKKAKPAEARLGSLTKTYCVVPESARAVQVACIQAVALYVSVLWCNPRDVGSRDDFEHLLNGQARSILGALPMTPRVALMIESGLTPAPVILDYRVQTTAIRRETSKRLQQQAEGATQQPLLRGTNMGSSQERA